MTAEAAVILGPFILIRLMQFSAHCERKWSFRHHVRVMIHISCTEYEIKESNLGSFLDSSFEPDIKKKQSYESTLVNMF